MQNRLAQRTQNGGSGAQQRRGYAIIFGGACGALFVWKLHRVYKAVELRSTTTTPISLPVSCIQNQQQRWQNFQPQPETTLSGAHMKVFGCCASLCVFVLFVWRPGRQNSHWLHMRINAVRACVLTQLLWAILAQFPALNLSAHKIATKYESNLRIRAFECANKLPPCIRKKQRVYRTKIAVL